MYFPKTIFDLRFMLFLALIGPVDAQTPVPADDSIASLRQKADVGDARAQARLGFCYHNGTGVEKDAVESVKWYRKAADQGDVNAEYALGMAYVLGSGVKKDFEEANAWFLKAAEQGDATAQCDLGLSYAMGEGVIKDNATAVNWYRKAAEQGHARAQYYLGSMYGCGEGVTQDYREALAWFIVSASSDDELAIKARDHFEEVLGVQVTLLAQQRSKEIFKDIEQSKAHAFEDKGVATDRATGDQPQSSGTGVFVSRDGLIITAAHVVKSALAIKVLTQQGLKSAQVIKIDTSNDVALLKCEGQFQAVPIISSTGVKLGQSVFTIGFPDIELQGFSPKMTQGEISSLSGVQDDPCDWQISVPVQPGNSGGPLFDAQGNVIGLVVAKLDAVITAQATGALPEDVNYAVKTAYVLPLLVPYADKLLPTSSVTSEPEKTEDVVARVQNSVVLILVY